ncbi:MAG: nitrate ABC transporter substrate-binding protein [Alteromonadaceae bacterium]|nr:MAG: nitrate ABC transporter substrate-binding protein [Alteromonadaceae bacterium]
MNKKVAFVVLIIGLIVLGALKFFVIGKEEDNALSSSDAKNIRETIDINVDSWVGYYLLCSKNFRASLRNEGIRSVCHNDNANLNDRFEKLRNGDIQFAVATIDAYLALGGDYQFPGTIVAIIDESKGGDALLANSDDIATLDDLKNNPQLRIALTPDSPSEHLIRSLAVHFDMPTFKKRGRWLKETESSEEACQKLINGDVDAAVCWEPDVTKTLLADNKLIKLIGSEDTEKLIVDVLLVNRAFAQEKPEIVKEVISHYFDTLSFYQQNPDNLVKELKKKTGLNTNSVQSMLKGVAWINLTDNAYDWFSTVDQTAPHEYLYESIESALSILQETEVKKENPLPNKDPYSITQSQFIEQLFEERVGSVSGQKLNQRKLGQSEDNKFRPLTQSQWKSLRSVGTLKVRNISFPKSSSDLSYSAKQLLDAAASDLSHYPNFRISVEGHTGLSGDKDANQRLSQERAESVVRYLNIAHGVSEDRMLATGVGSDEPLSKKPNESRRSYKYRLSRVELILKVGSL